MLILNSEIVDGSRQWALLFGLGQIGSAIRYSLENLDFVKALETSFDWQDKNLRHKESEYIHSYLEESAATDDRISVVWSAGVCGFHSDQNQAEAELGVFQEVLDLTRAIQASTTPTELNFHLVSSAGGLFEGQRVIDLNSKPSPKRQYGQLKLAQENAARVAMENSSLTIYRPSSVYGPMVQDVHRGLINNLVTNARNGNRTVLDSQVMSLRDYVYAGDIGNYIGRQIKWPTVSRNRQPHFLVSSRCSSIFEVVQKIRSVLNLNVYYTLDDSFGNNSNITFHQNVMPKGWRPATLEYGIRQFAIVH